MIWSYQALVKFGLFEIIIFGYFGMSEVSEIQFHFFTFPLIPIIWRLHFIVWNYNWYIHNTFQRIYFLFRKKNINLKNTQKKNLFFKHLYVKQWIPVMVIKGVLSYGFCCHFTDFVQELFSHFIDQHPKMLRKNMENEVFCNTL